jgi:CheY-like chemotaxis protein
MMTTTSDVSILIADDHKMVRDGLRLMLSLENKRKNYFITEATDGAEAVSIAIQKKFDIILLDYRMPKIMPCSGYWYISQMQKLLCSPIMMKEHSFKTLFAMAQKDTY